MTDLDPPPSRPARLPRQREVPRARARLKGPVAPEPGRPRRGLTGPMKAVLVGVGVVGALSFALIRCADRGKATRSNANWNRPPRTTERAVALDDLIRQAETRAAATLPDGTLARLSARHVDRDGMLHLDYGSASFEFETPGATPCSVHLVIGWQGWAERPGGTCHEPPRPPGCAAGAIVGRAFTGKTSETATVEYDGGWTVWFRDESEPVELADDCNPN